VFTLDGVVPWGRSFDEYLRMFSLSERDLELKILGCGDGPASFNSEASRRGWRVVSCDPIYQWSASDIRSRVAETYEQIMEQTRQNADEFVWTSIPSVEELGRRRMAAMEAFLDDYDAGKTEGRYVAGSLPVLPFADDTFDLALCSHLLFLYTAQLGEDFHKSAVRELRRVAREVRIFPLLALGGERSPYVETVAALAHAAGDEAVVETVPYEFRRGGNQMMKVRATKDLERF
jgi:hypothetical protein